MEDTVILADAGANLGLSSQGSRGPKKRPREKKLKMPGDM
jgi:hypothetical protein